MEKVNYPESKERYQPLLILLDGSKGAGKSSLSEMLVQKIANTNSLSLDTERRSSPNQDGTLTERNARAFEELHTKARMLLKSGVNVVIDCGLTPERIATFETLSAETGAVLKKFFLKASYDTLLKRVGERDRSKGKETDVARFDQVYSIIHDKDLSQHDVIETDNVSLDEIANIILTSVQR